MGRKATGYKKELIHWWTPTLKHSKKLLRQVPSKTTEKEKAFRTNAIEKPRCMPLKFHSV